MPLMTKLMQRVVTPTYRHAPPPVDAAWAFPTTLFSAVDDAPASPRLLRLAIDAARIARTLTLDDLAKRPGSRIWLNIWPGEHYRLLAALMLVLKPRVVVEVGTAEGMSALTLLQHLPSDARLYTFDIVPWTQVPDPMLREEDFADGRLVQCLGDLGQADAFEAHRDILQSAEFFFIDGPKDGRTERNLLAQLKTLKFARPPILMFDDIRLWSMLEIWRRLPCPKLDFTSLGHTSGTGLVEWTE